MLYQENRDLGVALSRVAFGGAGISGEGGGYGFGPMSEKDAEGLLRFSWEQGINLYDTAPVYGFGLSEERMGRYLPKEAVIISKSGVDWHSSSRINMTNDPKVTERMLYESLKRLRRDVIDVYMVHWPDRKVDIRRTLEPLVKAQQSGHIKVLGLCNTHSEDLLRAREVCRVAFLQSEVNLFSPGTFGALGETAGESFTMGWGTFDKGILSGRVSANRTFSAEDCRSWAPWWKKKMVQEKVEKTRRLNELLQETHWGLSTFALSFGLHYEGVASALVGLRSVADVVEVTSSLRVEYIRERMEEVLTKWKS